MKCYQKRFVRIPSAIDVIDGHTSNLAGTMKKMHELESLSGSLVSSVSFVQDYIEIGFDGPTLRLLGETVLKVSGVPDYTDGGIAFEHGLRKLIGRAFIGGEVEEDRTVSLVFSQGYDISVRSQGSEFLHFMPSSDGRVLVW